MSKASLGPESVAPRNGKAGFCALLGNPNVGKSTLINQVTGVKLCAVSSKPQTTRNRILGVYHSDEAAPVKTQIAFVDTPGLQDGGGPLRSFMREEASSAAQDADVILWMIDATELADDKVNVEELLPLAIMNANKPVLCALNKIDLVKSKNQLIPGMQALSDTGKFFAIVPICAESGDGVDGLISLICEKLPDGPMLFPDDMLTDRAERFIASELIREQLFLQLGKEVPYASAIIIETFEERRLKKDIVISAIIHVEREGQKAIVVGKGGQQIRSLGEKGRAVLSQFFGCPVHLKLNVRVTTAWSQHGHMVQEMGYKS